MHKPSRWFSRALLVSYTLPASVQDVPSLISLKSSRSSTRCLFYNIYPPVLSNTIENNQSQLIYSPVDCSTRISISRRTTGSRIYILDKSLRTRSSQWSWSEYSYALILCSREGLRQILANNVLFRRCNTRAAFFAIHRSATLFFELLDDKHEAFRNSWRSGWGY